MGGPPITDENEVLTGVRPLTPADAATLADAAVMSALSTSSAGLQEREAERRRQLFGPNVLRERRVTVVDVLIGQLRNPLLILLIGAIVVSALTGDPAGAAIIAVIVVLSVGLGFVNEYRAATAVAALHAAVRHFTIVRRDGTQRRVPTSELVIGDVVTLGVGDIVPADLRVITATGLECDEAVLTGESLPVGKHAEVAGRGAGPFDVANCAFMGTVVHRGGGTGVVIATGTDTAFGQVSVGLATRPAETAFQQGLRSFSGLLAKVAAVLTASIFIMNVVLSRPLIDALLFSLAIAIGITPQLLPAIVSLSLAKGSRILAARRVLVKRLVAIEDLGNIEILFTDKTGTLTHGEVTFHQALDVRGEQSDEVLRLGLLCSDIDMSPDGPIAGNALDQSLAQAPGAEAMLAVGDAARTGSLPFDHERQLASVVVTGTHGERLLITKGAPEAVMARCLATGAQPAALLERMFDAGERVVAVATRPAGKVVVPAADDERDLQLVGFLSFIDQPKADAAGALAQLADLGVTVKVITGDNPAVAARVCAEIGLAVTGTLTGAQTASMDDEELAAAIATTTIFGRVGPQDKARLVAVARRGGADVAFLGDGVNDAVALHAADVGISVDTATDIAKDAADVLLLDKSLGVLAEGIMQGRAIFANTMKYVLMATSSNFGNMFSAAGASMFLTFLPMLPSQVLLTNLLYDTGQLAIPTDRVDPEVMARPAAWDLHFVRRFMGIFGPVSSLFDVLTFVVMLAVLNAGHAEFRTGWFIESLATQTLVIFVIRTRRVPFTRSRPSRPMIALPIACALVGAVLPFTPLAGPLGFARLPAVFFVILLAMIATYLLLVEVVKYGFYRAQDRPPRERPGRGDRHERHVERRAARFDRHHPPAGQAHP